MIGDNLTHTELYIPLDGSRSSRSYLAYGARAMGMDLVPRGRPGSGLARSRAGLPSSAGIVRAVVGQPAQQHMSLAPVAAAVLAGNAELRAEIATLGRQLRDLPRGDVVQNFPNATDSAESQRSSAVGYRAARGR